MQVLCANATTPAAAPGLARPAMPRLGSAPSQSLVDSAVFPRVGVTFDPCVGILCYDPDGTVAEMLLIAFCATAPLASEKDTRSKVRNLASDDSELEFGLGERPGVRTEADPHTAPELPCKRQRTWGAGLMDMGTFCDTTEPWISVDMRLCVLPDEGNLLSAFAALTEAQGAH